MWIFLPAVAVCKECHWLFNQLVGRTTDKKTWQLCHYNMIPNRSRAVQMQLQNRHYWQTNLSGLLQINCSFTTFIAFIINTFNMLLICPILLFTCTFQIIYCIIRPLFSCHLFTGMWWNEKWKGGWKQEKMCSFKEPFQGFCTFPEYDITQLTFPFFIFLEPPPTQETSRRKTRERLRASGECSKGSETQAAQCECISVFYIMYFLKLCTTKNISGHKGCWVSHRWHRDHGFWNIQ